ncbi:MAG TPA: ribonuclease T2 [Steroidobacteraceae bacterium]
MSGSTTYRIHIALAAALMALAALAAQARHHHASTRRSGDAGQFDYYVLSLSWAPTYCLTHSDDSQECSGKGFGFVLHGLWPQFDAGGYPVNCSTQLELSADAAAKGRTIYPSERLMRHEWKEHGTCSGLDAREYFNVADRATAVIKIPAALQAPRSDQGLTAEQIANLFRDANPRVIEGAITVACNRAELSEVRVCLTRDLKPRSCGRGVHSNCPRAPLNIPASR